jgi:hypothetical protein
LIGVDELCGGMKTYRGESGRRQQHLWSPRGRSTGALPPVVDDNILRGALDRLVDDVRVVVEPLQIGAAQFDVAGWFVGCGHEAGSP